MIAKNIDVKLNVRPIYIGLVHEYAYEDRAVSGKAMHWKKNMIRW